MLLIFLGLFFLAPAIWLLSGFSNGLRPKNGRWYFIGTFDKIYGVVNGSSSFPIIPLPWPFKHIKLELTWTEYQKPDEVYKGKMRVYPNIDVVIGTKAEYTNIRHLEEHPIEVPAVLKDGYQVVLILDVTLEVFDPMLLVPRKGFLTYTQQEFGDILLPWIKASKDLDSILELEIEEVRKITFDVYGETYNLETFLNKNKFEPYRFRIKELALKVGLTEETFDYFRIQNEVKKKEQEKELAEKNEIVREVQRKTAMNDADAEREIQKKDLAVTADYQKEIMAADYDGQAKVAGSYKVDVLVLNGNSGGKELSNAQNMTNAVVGNLIAHKRMKNNQNTNLEEK